MLQKLACLINKAGFLTWYNQCKPNACGCVGMGAENLLKKKRSNRHCTNYLLVTKILKNQNSSMMMLCLCVCVHRDITHGTRVQGVYIHCLCISAFLCLFIFNF